MAAVVELAPRMGTAPACAALGLPRASWYRHARPPQAAAACASREDWVGPEQASPAPSRSHPRALDPSEQEAVLSVLHSERFVDKAPATVYATLLDEGTYVCSQRTMYRILEANSEVRERRDQLRHPSYVKPELVATGPNQVWSWDITKLRGPSKLEWFFLYVILDIFSRFVVGWMVARRETALLAERLLRETCVKQGIEPGSLAIHSDRGAPMVAQTVAQLLVALGVEKSHSRPHVSNDNPYSEAQFKTLKYRPSFPDRFGSLEDALTFGREFFASPEANVGGRGG
jgi:putative transposase